MLAAGDQVPASRPDRIRELAADRRVGADGGECACIEGRRHAGEAEIGPGDQSNMAFMHTPVTHGGGMMIVTATGGDAQVGRIANMLTTTGREETPLTRWSAEAASCHPFAAANATSRNELTAGR